MSKLLLRTKKFIEQTVPWFRALQSNLKALMKMQIENEQWEYLYQCELEDYQKNVSSKNGNKTFFNVQEKSNERSHDQF